MHKSLSQALGAALLLFSSLAVPTPAKAAPKNNPFDPVALCKWMASEGHFQSVGDCVSGFHADAAKFCQSLKEGGYLVQYGYRNMGECVRSFDSEWDDS